VASGLWHSLGVRRAPQPVCRPSAAGRTIPTVGVVLLLATAGCTTVDLGDNFVAPDVQLNEDYFFCKVQPEAIAAYHCAGGAAGEMGSCHSARSALRLSIMGETDAPPTCTETAPDDFTVSGTVPASYMTNLEAVRLDVQSDPLSSPLYRRPLGLDSHPRVVFPDASDPGAVIIQTWITRGGM